MATYPGGVYSPAAKANGQTIQAAWFNDPDSEIAAVENALISGLAHPVTVAGAVTVSTGGLTVSTGGLRVGGPSTLQAVQITGNSTVTGDLTVSGALTVGSFGALTFGDPVTLSSGAVVSTGVIRQNSLPAFSVYNSSHVVLVNGSSVQGVSFDAQDFVRGNVAHSTSATSSRVTLNTTGLYQIIGRGLVQSPGQNPRMKLTVLFNDTTALVTAAHGWNASDPAATMDVFGIVRISSTGYLTLRVTSSNSANSTVGSTNPALSLRLSGVFLG